MQIGMRYPQPLVKEVLEKLNFDTFEIHSTFVQPYERAWFHRRTSQAFHEATGKLLTALHLKARQRVLTSLRLVGSSTA